MLTTDEGVFEFVKQHLLTQGQNQQQLQVVFINKTMD